MDNYNLTPADVAMMTKHHDRSAMAATGIGLGAGLGGGALLLAIGLGWGINQASKARARAAEQANQANANTTNLLTQFLIAERQCQHNWQLANTPTISQMVDVRVVSQQGQQSTATAEALALAAAIGNQQGGINMWQPSACRASSPTYLAMAVALAPRSNLSAKNFPFLFRAQPLLHR